MAKKIIKSAAHFEAAELKLSNTVAQAFGKNKRVTNAVLVLNVTSPNSFGYKVAVKYNGGNPQIIDFVAPQSAGKVSVNVTEELNCLLSNSADNISFVFEPQITVSGNVDLYAEYVSQQIMHESNAYLPLDAKRAGSGKINLATGKLRFSSSGLTYNAWQANNGVINVDDAESLSSFATHCGKGWQLKASQFLVKRAGDERENYVYVDGEGNFHEFEDKYYVTEGEQKVYVPKNAVFVDLDGNLTHEGKKVQTERRSSSGLTLAANYDGFAGANLLEQRRQEQAELEENVTAYADTLKQFVIVTEASGYTIDNGKLKDKFENGALSAQAFDVFEEQLTNSRMLLTESEAIQYNMLLLQQTSDEKVTTKGIKGITDSAYKSSVDYSVKLKDGNVFQKGGYNKKLINLKLLVKHLRKDFATLTKKINCAQKGKDPAYFYREYDAFKRDNKLQSFLNCRLHVIGKGREKSGNPNNWLHTDTNGVYANSDNEAYLHLADNVCDLEAELHAIEDDLDTYSRYGTPEGEEKAKAKEIEQFIRQFQANFSGRVDKLQQNIADFEAEINEFIEKEQRELVNRQITMLKERSQTNARDIRKYFKLYVNKQHELETLYSQMPVNFVLSQDAAAGFNKDGRLVLAADNYDNQTAYVYQGDKLVQIRDTNDNAVDFLYDESGLLCKIVDEKEKETAFTYDDGYLTKITRGENKALFAYSPDGLLTSVTDGYGRGFTFTYDVYGKVVTANEVTKLASVTEQGAQSLDQAVSKTLATINYHESHLTTTVTDERGNSTTYVLDILGKPVTVYKGDYGNAVSATRSASFQYVDDLQNYSVTENPHSVNLVKEMTVPLVLKGYAEMTGYLPGFSMDNAEENPEGFESAAAEYVDSSSTVESNAKRKYQVDVSKVQEGANLVLSAWARADSACIATKRTLSYNDFTDANLGVAQDTYKARRKFELRAKATYADNTVTVCSASYDWLNTDWQYLALPVRIKKGATLTKLELFLDYSFNTGNAYFDKLSLRRGDFVYTKLDSAKKKVYSLDSKKGTTTNYYYQGDKLVKEMTADAKGERTVTLYEYDKQGSIIRTTVDNIVTQTELDGKGRLLRKVTYDVADPTSKLYVESKRSDKGEIIADIDESGTYDSVTYGANGVLTDGKGNVTVNGYIDGNLVSVSGSTDGEESTNVLNYTADLLTKASNGETSYNYEYDGWGRVVKAEIANRPYCQTEHVTELQTKTVLISNDVVETAVDKDGKPLQKTTTFAGGTEEKVTNTYGTDGELVKTSVDIDGENKYNITYSYDSESRVISEERNGEYPLRKSYSYQDGKINQVHQHVNNELLSYAVSASKRKADIQIPYGIMNRIAYDGLGRTKTVSLGDKLAKDIYYAKYGDHATNRINSVWHGVNGIRKDNVKYTYDKAGNVETVTENGKLVAKYSYDGLNRLVREETSDFGVITYSYDTAGNVIRKAVNGEEYVYTYPQSGWKDQLHQRSYKDAIGQEVIETFAYDGLGNPTVYRNRPLTWQCRRLKQYGNTIFTYDADGVRTSKTSNGILTKYIYDGNNLVAEQRGTNWIYYLYGAEGIAGFNNGFTYLFRKNLQGDVTHIYKQLPDNRLEQVGQYSYDAWGNCKILQDVDGIATLNPFRYRGYYFDEETGLYYLQTRYYDPDLGRFISADSIEYLDSETLGGLNLYAYCNNNPVMFTDPEGTEWWNPFTWNWGDIGKVVGGALLTIVGVATAVTGLISSLIPIAGGLITHIGTAMAAYGGITIASVWNSQIQQDMDNIHWNPFNLDAAIAVGSQNVSFYRGMPVIRFDSDVLSSFQVGGIIFFERGRGEISLRHESGHGIQETILGFPKYLTNIAIPSVIMNVIGRHYLPINQFYYNFPWERTADWFGGVGTRSDHIKGSLAVGILYFIMSTLL